MLPPTNRPEYDRFEILFRERKEHPLKKTFLNRVRYSRLAEYLGCEEGTVSRYLNGHVAIPEHLDRKLYELAEKMERMAHDAA